MARANADPLALFARTFDDQFVAALAARSAGAPVVGYLSPVAPVELIEAAGAFPLRLDGRGIVETPHADAIMERLFDPPVRGVCESLLAGDLSFLDAVILPRTTDSVQRLYYYLCEFRRTDGTAPVPLLYDILHTPFYSSAEYDYRSLEGLKSALEALLGAPIQDGALSRAIMASNHRIAALESLSMLRREGRISGVQALEIYTAARCMAADDFIAAADALIANPPAPTISAGTRVILAGNGPDTRALHQAIEAAGASIVGDFHDRGELSIGARFDETLPPLRALNDHYHRGTVSSRTFPAQPGAVASFAAAAQAEAAIFFFHAEEEVLTWDYPAQRRALAAAGLPSLCLSGQPYRIDVDATRAAVGAFLAQRRAA